MPPKKGKKPPKGKGKPKQKAGLRKFDTDLFGLLTFTRYFGAPFEEFMYAGDKKKQKSFKDAANKKKKKKKKPVDVPKLPHFPEVPEPEQPLRLDEPPRITEKKLIFPTTTVGRTERTTRPMRKAVDSGSVRDITCGERQPLPPRPLPHGGVFGNAKCEQCTFKGGLTKTIWGTLHKKMKKILTKHFDKAKYVLEYIIGKLDESLIMYENHMESVMKEMAPLLDMMDASEWDDHFEVKKLYDQWRTQKIQLDSLRAELKYLQRHRQEEIDKATAEKRREVEEAELRLLGLEKQIQDLQEELAYWRDEGEAKLKSLQDELAKIQAFIRSMREAVLLERDNLREMLGWETNLATSETVKEMETIIAKDLDEIVGWLHPAWFRLVMENRKMEEERRRLNVENHLLQVEIETLKRQVDLMTHHKKEMEANKTLTYRPAGLQEAVNRYLTHNPSAKLQLFNYPPFNLLHE